MNVTNINKPSIEAIITHFCISSIIVLSAETSLEHRRDILTVSSNERTSGDEMIILDVVRVSVGDC